MDRKAQATLHQGRSSIERRASSTQAVEFFNLLTSPELLQTTEALLPEHRERLYPPTVTLSMFMRQVLEADGSCQKAVNGWAAQRAADGLSACSVRTGGYCRARQRLPLEMVRALTRQTGRLLSQKALTQWLWRSRAVKLVDGTGLSMPDTLENQAAYPQPSTQAAGVGFPLARLVRVICLATGAALDTALGPHQGKGSGELGLVRRLLEGFKPGDVMLADALYCNYFLIAALMAFLFFREHIPRATWIAIAAVIAGVAVMVSPRLWAWLLDRYRDGRPLALLNALLGVATILPVLSNAWALVLLSGMLFGAVFLSLVASTTALVRHNLPQSQWAAGISAFTIVFAAGQIAGPTVVGSIADGLGAGNDLQGLQRGLIFSAGVLWLGALVSMQQRALRD